MASSHNLPLSQAQRIATAEVLPEFADRLKLEAKNLRKISFTVKELESIRQKIDAARSHAGTGMKRTSLRHVVDAITNTLEVASGIGGQFDPEKFDAEKATKKMRRGLPDWRLM